jgi:hypothetical protein
MANWFERFLRAIAQLKAERRLSRLARSPECPAMVRQGQRIIAWCWLHDVSVDATIQARNRRKLNHLKVCPVCQRYAQIEPQQPTAPKDAELHARYDG